MVYFSDLPTARGKGCVNLTINVPLTSEVFNTIDHCLSQNQKNSAGQTMISIVNGSPAAGSGNKRAASIGGLGR
jgi:hypothetical protein